MMTATRPRMSRSDRADEPVSHVTDDPGDRARAPMPGFPDHRRFALVQLDDAGDAVQPDLARPARPALPGRAAGGVLPRLRAGGRRRRRRRPRHRVRRRRAACSWCSPPATRSHETTANLPPRCWSTRHPARRPGHPRRARAPGRRTAARRCLTDGRRADPGYRGPMLVLSRRAGRASSSATTSPSPSSRSAATSCASASTRPAPLKVHRAELLAQLEESNREAASPSEDVVACSPRPCATAPLTHAPTLGLRPLAHAPPTRAFLRAHPCVVARRRACSCVPRCRFLRAVRRCDPRDSDG